MQFSLEYMSSRKFNIYSFHFKIHSRKSKNVGALTILQFKF
ncbi:hypothetical protein LEP1GSC007_0234 [Leptospira interrogans serovar Bulgarica str. Mallika]|nr:hypothetical protein LEP1GSC007_0234 [Leptospira interrogans serovar Bulgarica str. Mallika]